MEVDTIKYFPGHIVRIREFQELARCFDSTMQPLWAVMDRLHDNQFIDMLDDYGCEIQENLLGIKRNPIDGLEDRRKRIKGYYVSDLPYTEKKMNEVLAAMCGAEGYSLIINKKTKVVTINLKLNSMSLVNNAYELIKRMMPCTMILEVKIIYNTYAIFKNMTYGEMSGYTHEQLHEGKQFQENDYVTKR